MSEKDTQTSDAAYGEVLDEMDHQAKYQSATINTRREQEVRIQALGAALSRRDWHATERAYETIRDHFDRTPDSRPAQEQKSQAKEPRQSGDNSGTDPSRPRTAVRVGEPTRIGAVVGDQVAEEPSSVSPQDAPAQSTLEPVAWRSLHHVSGLYEYGTVAPYVHSEPLYLHPPCAPQSEPVAWQRLVKIANDEGHIVDDWQQISPNSIGDLGEKGIPVRPLYTVPPQERPPARGVEALAKVIFGDDEAWSDAPKDIYYGIAHRVLAFQHSQEENATRDEIKGSYLHGRADAGDEIEQLHKENAKLRADVAQLCGRIARELAETERLSAQVEAKLPAGFKPVYLKAARTIVYAGKEAAEAILKLNGEAVAASDPDRIFNETCKRCDGSGDHPGGPPGNQMCSDCDGRGFIPSTPSFSSEKSA